MFPPERDWQQSPPSSSSAFALLALNGTSRIRALHFPPDSYSRLTTYIKQSWPEGIEWATLQSGEGWDCLLKGTPWKKKGSEELESIRLILGILETLSQDGWHLMQDVFVGSSKTDVHHFVFRHHDDLSSRIEKFFAVTFPLPNRISLVDPPIALTPVIISAIRSAVLTPDLSPEELQTPRAFRKEGNPQMGIQREETVPGLESRQMGSSSYRSGHPGLRRVKDGHFGSEARSSTEGRIKIKAEAWVASGVYGFELGGYSVFAGRGTSDFKYDSRQPTLLLALLANLDQQQSHLVTSVRLMPTNARRDILVFQNTTFEDDLENPIELILPPRLSFPSAAGSPTSPTLSIDVAGTQKQSRRSVRVRPSSLASLNGGPLLPSIPASPSTPWGDAAPSSFRMHSKSAAIDNSAGEFYLDRQDENVTSVSHPARPRFLGPVTAGARIESHTTSPHLNGTSPFLGQRKHKKSLSMPGKAANGWRTPPAPRHQVSHMKSLPKFENLQDSINQMNGKPRNNERTPALASSPTSPIFVSNGSVKVKAAINQPQLPTIGHVKNSDAVRESQRPEVGIIHSQSFAQRRSNIDSGDQSADSLVDQKARRKSMSGGDAKSSSRPRRSFRSFFRGLK